MMTNILMIIYMIMMTQMMIKTIRIIMDEHDFYDHDYTDDDNYDYFDVVAGVITNLQLDEETLRDILTKVFPSGGRSLFTFTFLLIIYV